MSIKFVAVLYFLTTLPLMAQNEDKKYELERLVRQRNHIDQTATYQFSLPAGDSTLVERRYYDRQGHLIKRESYDGAGKLQYKGVLTYNDKGLMTQETGYDGAGELVQQFVYQYDQNGHRTDYQQVGADKKVITHQQSVYNGKGQRTKLYSYSSDQGGFRLSATFTYDGVGRTLTYTRYSANGDTGGINFYSYDANGNLTQTTLRAGQQDTPLFTNRYNENNQLVETQFYQQSAYRADRRPLPQAIDRSVRYQYDGEGNLVEESIWSQTNLVSKKRYYFIKQQS